MYLNEIRSPQNNTGPNDFAIPNIGNFPQSVTNAQGLGSGLIMG